MTSGLDPLANYSAAFGYDVFIVPLSVNAVDTAFTGVTAGIATSTGFIDLGTSNANVIAANSTVSYTGGIFTVESTAFDMDGTDKIARLYGLTNASLGTDTNSGNIITYDS